MPSGELLVCLVDYVKVGLSEGSIARSHQPAQKTIWKKCNEEELQSVNSYGFLLITYFIILLCPTH
jgi:hypothetical protein